MDIAACPQCASQEIAMATVRDGVLPGVTGGRAAVCRDCSFQGVPLLFAQERDYEDFRAAVERNENPLQAGAAEGGGVEKEDPMAPTDLATDDPASPARGEEELLARDEQSAPPRRTAWNVLIAVLAVGGLLLNGFRLTASVQQGEPFLSQRIILPLVLVLFWSIVLIRVATRLQAQRARP